MILISLKMWDTNQNWNHYAVIYVEGKKESVLIFFLNILYAWKGGRVILIQDDYRIRLLFWTTEI